ncbi:MAG: DMT family transporter [Alphaproteobacteria bacterium]|nr:DMT family transporter [Alphaproteobacteria bacterium]
MTEITKEIAKGGRGQLYVWAAVLIFAAANSIVQLLHMLGAANPVEGRNAISFCNVLFVGNLCAAATLFAIYRRTWTGETLKALTPADWISLTVLALLSSALAPALLFLAIENTTVTNVVLVGRIEPPLLLVLSVLVLAERPDGWTWAGGAISLAGVGVIFYLQARETGVMLGKGELLAAAAAATLACSTVVSKVRLKNIPIGIFTVYRTGVGTIIFFFAALYLFGIDHFQDAFSPLLWQWMVVYGAIIVVGGQLLWFTGIRTASTADASLATSFSPIAGLVFAFLLLGERPGLPVLAGGAVILSGIAVAQIGGYYRRRAESRRQLSDAVELEGKVSFKGV